MSKKSLKSKIVLSIQQTIDQQAATSPQPLMINAEELLKTIMRFSGKTNLR